MQYATGTFNSPTSAATDTTVSGLSFQPKLIRVWVGGSGSGFGADYFDGYGMASGTGTGAQRCWGQNADDNVATSDCATSWYDGIVSIPNPAGTLLIQGRVSAIASDGFTIDWDTVPAVALPFRWEAWGGSDIECEVGEFAHNTGTGNHQVNTTIEPDTDSVLILFGTRRTAIGIGAANAGCGYGIAKSSSARWAWADSLRDGQTMTANLDAGKYQRSIYCYVQLGATGPTEDVADDFVSFDGASGFTINVVNAPAAAYLVGYAIIKGGQHAVGVFDKTTSAAPVDQDVTVGFQPIGVALHSFNNVAATVVSADMEHSIGAFDGSAEGSSWHQHKDAVINTEANFNSSNTKAIVLCESPTTVDSEADGSMLSTGFRLGWTTNLTSKADEICYHAFASAPSIPPLGPSMHEMDRMQSDVMAAISRY